MKGYYFFIVSTMLAANMQALILIPGLLCDQAVWEHQVNHLRDDANILIANVDHASTPVEMVNAVLKGAPKQFALAGHSMGGWIALEIMRHHPERVTKLILANTTALLDSPQKAQGRHDLLKLAYENKHDVIIERLLSAFVFQRRFAPIVKAMLQRNINYLINQEKAMLQREDCVPLLKTILCPTTIIHANQDAIFDFQDSQILHEHITGSVLERLDHSGHMSPIEAAEGFTDIMKIWLSIV